MSDATAVQVDTQHTPDLDAMQRRINEMHEDIALGVFRQRSHVTWPQAKVSTQHIACAPYEPHTTSQGDSMQPSVGRIVHYVSHGTPVKADGTQAYTSLPRAAVITAVHDMDPVPEHGVPHVDLCVLNPTGLFFNTNVRYDEGGTSDTPGAPATRSYEGGTWHWPPRV